ncbi:MAG: GWxTD domain-containing protein, partial [bacterium]|nr:GWxTD domain-containing protein [bacterium]
MDAAGNFVVAWRSGSGIWEPDGDGSGISAQRFRSPCSDSLSLTAGQWKMISLPCDPGTANTVAEVFGDDLSGTYASDWVVYERDEAGDAYDQMAQTSPVAMGVGYWIATAMIGETIDVDGLSPSTDVALESSGSGVQNLVGHPFAFDVCWADVRVVDGSSLLTLDEADPAGECETRRLFPCVIRRWRHHRHLGISTQSADSTAFPRGRFIEEFWRERDPDPRTVRNELLDDWKIRVAAVRASYPSAGDVRARMMLLNGLPTERVEVNCRGTTWPIEVWFYVFTERFREPFALIFYRRWGVGDWQLWGDDPENTKDLYNTSTFTGEALGKPGGTLFAKPSQCNFDALLAAFKIIRELKLKGVDYMMLLYELTEPDRPDADEWVRTFTSYSTDLPEGAATFPVDIRFDFPGWHQNRTVVQGLVSVPSAELEATDLRGYASYNLAMNGEVLLG